MALPRTIPAKASLTSFAGLVLLFLLGQGSLFSQAPRGVPAGRYALSEDVVRPYGQYQYLPQKGLYKDITIGEAAGDFKEALSNLSVSVYNLNNYLRWGSVHSGEELSWNFGANLGFGPPVYGVRFGNGYDGMQSQYFSVLAGPLVLDNFYLGYAAIYSDLYGTYSNPVALTTDDRWAQMIFLSFRASLRLGDSIGISLQPFIYWLPSTGKVGWALPGPFAGIMMPQLGSNTLLQIAWVKQYGNWRVAAYDQFSPLLSMYNIWDVFLNANAFWGDLSPVDRVGRYAVGYGAGDVTNYDPQSRFGFGNTDWNGVGGYYNLAGIRATHDHSPSTQSIYFFNRNDFWNRDFKRVWSAIFGGAYLRSGTPYFSTYAGYEFMSVGPDDDYLHSAVVGANKRFSDVISGYAQAGYFWYSGESDTGSGGWLGEAGLQQRLGERTIHGVRGGRRVLRAATAMGGIETFAEYYFAHQIGGRTSINFFAGMSDRSLHAGTESDYVLKYAGTIITSQFSQRLTSFASSGWESFEIEARRMELDRWTHRLGLMYQVTQDIQSQCFYQYEDTHGSINYSEHYLYLGVTKRF